MFLIIVFGYFGYCIWLLYFHTYEGFNSSKETIVLLGDSILKNNLYISNGKSIEDILIERTNGKSYCYAMDDSKIVDVYKQVSKIPLNFNTQNTLIFLSVGGNDILSNYVYKESDITDTSVLQIMFSNYKKLIESIKIRSPIAKIYLLDIYYPSNSKYSQYHNIINKWNNMLYSYVNNPKNNISGILKVSHLLTKSNDFVFDIEPSSNGGQKIIQNILNM